MKRFKRLLIITATITAILASIVFSACNFKANGNVTDSLESSVTLASEVEIQTSTTEATDITDAVSKTEKTAVAIQMVDESSWGSGVIVDIKKYDGATEITEANTYYVVTCYHVISGGGKIVVYVPDNEGDNYTDENYDDSYAFSGNITATKDNASTVCLVGGDSVSDIAVLRIKTSKTLTKASIPDSRTYETKKGESVYAIGNPTGALPGTVSTGTISYIGRILTISGAGSMKLTQIDVPINHGNSGGGLYNSDGQLIGITNAGNDSYECINYAIPLYVTYQGEERGFVAIARQLIATETESTYGYISGRWALGITVASSRGYVYVTGVTAGGNAANAGLKEGDILSSVTVGQTRYDCSSSTFMTLIGLLKSTLSGGDSFVITVQRSNGSNGWIQTYTTLDVAVNITQLGYIFVPGSTI